jgi:UDP-N-acetylglucosamine--N-acetylmuramyl-(pentapeptide) pyrophosphoryl-undecaprenol N-acetylglucosamine transferase
METKGKSLRFLVAGGGTGGHIFPAVAIAQAIQKLHPDSVFLFVGAEGKMEMEKVPQAGFDIVGLPIAGFNRSSLIKNIGLPLKLIKSFFSVARIIRRFRPDAVIGVGGYSSYPVLRFAQSKGILTFIHEANSFAGKSNQMLGKKAVKIFTGTDGMEKFFPAEKIVVTGNPVRKSILERQITREEALAFFGLDQRKTTILSIGGSLGAQSINQAIANNINLLNREDIQLIWQTGKQFDASSYQVPSHWYMNAFIEKMEYAFAAADIVISRSGAMSVAELCLTGKPVIFVPYPHAAENHQYVNAMKLVEKNAAMLVHDKEVDKELIPAVLSLTNNHELQQTFHHNIQKEGKKDADVVVAQEILNYLK